MTYTIKHKHYAKHKNGTNFSGTGTGPAKEECPTLGDREESAQKTQPKIPSGPTVSEKRQTGDTVCTSKGV